MYVIDERIDHAVAQEPTAAERVSGAHDQPPE
jgi:hypothetical protein